MFTIQSIIMETLLVHEVVEHSGKKVKVGLTYDEVLAEVKKQVKESPFMADECNTSKACISWYASKMRKEGHKHYNKAILEIMRPKASPKKAK